MMKKEVWMYLAAVLAVVAVVFFAFSLTFNQIASPVTAKSEVAPSAWTVSAVTHTEKAKSFSFFDILTIKPHQLDQEQDILGLQGDNN